MSAQRVPLSQKRTAPVRNDGIVPVVLLMVTPKRVDGIRAGELTQAGPDIHWSGCPAEVRRRAGPLLAAVTGTRRGHRRGHGNERKRASSRTADGLPGRGGRRRVLGCVGSWRAGAGRGVGAGLLGFLTDFIRDLG